ncbi:hypothetical protein RRG08_059538 [Elysia crispata]|uniref:DUF4524 domain-containing protein n=1 Tax=Elysia crispata TaxID=231223 RepID=A0AAE0XRB1_9GAST|nr:hypothetical protein RRG08_059538 [Elysia crispata]
MSRVVPLLMVLYSNDAVEVRYSDGSALQLSSCGSTMIHHGAASHKRLSGKGSGNIHKRSRFVTSEHRQKVLQAMDFRNRFAERPYLCEELLDRDQIVSLYAFIGSVTWSANPAEADVEILQDGSRKINSLDDYASLIISPHGHDFTVCYLSKLSTDSSKPKPKVSNISRSYSDKPGYDNSPSAHQSTNMKRTNDERKTRTDSVLKLNEAVVHPFQSQNNIHPAQPFFNADLPQSSQTQALPRQHNERQKKSCQFLQKSDSHQSPNHMSHFHLNSKDPNTCQDLSALTAAQQDQTKNNAKIDGPQELPYSFNKHVEPLTNSSINSQDISSISRSSTPDGLRMTIDSDASLGTQDSSHLVHVQAYPREQYRQRHSSPTNFTSSPYDEAIKGQSQGIRESHYGADGDLGGSYLADNPLHKAESEEECGLDRTICEEDNAPAELSRTVVGEESHQAVLLPLPQTPGADNISNPTPSIGDNPVQTQMVKEINGCNVTTGEKVKYGAILTIHPLHCLPQERELEFAAQSLEPTNTSGFMPEIGEKSQKSQCQSLYVWTTTHISRNACPLAWTHPLKLVQTARSLQDHHNQDRSEDKATSTSKGKQSSPLPEPLPVTCPFQHLHKWDVEKTLNVSDASGSLEFQHGMLKVVISEGIVYRFVTVAKIHIVEIHPGDGSIIVSQGVKGHFYTHYITVEDRLEERTYSLKSLPAGQCKGSYSISKLIQTANRYLMMNHQWERRGLKQKLPCWKRETVAVVEPLSSSLLEECVVEGLGKFSAFTNGRVRAVFEDRTALDMVCNFSKRTSESLQHGHEPKVSLPAARQVSLPVSSYEAIFGASTARLLLPSGQYVTVDIQNPGQYKSYIQAGREWASWVNSSTMERHQFYTQKHTPSVMLRAAEHELKKIFCFNYILEQTLQVQKDLECSGLDHASSSRTTTSSVPSSGECEYSYAQSCKFLQLANQGQPGRYNQSQGASSPCEPTQNHQLQFIQAPYYVSSDVQEPLYPASQNIAGFHSWSGSTSIPDGSHLGPKKKKSNQQTTLKSRHTEVASVSNQMARSEERAQSITDGFHAVRQVLLRNSNLINDIDEFLDSSRKQNLLQSPRKEDD